MPFLLSKYKTLIDELNDKNVTLIAVSKTKPEVDILMAYKAGQRDFGENYVQELISKQTALPADIRWHFIGHLQSNKVKFVVPFVHLIHGVDSIKLLTEINKQGEKQEKKIKCLLQVHIAEEETKFGFDEKELGDVDFSGYKYVQIKGLMGMASFSDDTDKIRSEFIKLRTIFNKYMNQEFDTLSMGMSSDYKTAIEEGSNMVRIGSLIFGERE